MTVCSRPEGGLRCREGVKPPVNQSINQSNTTESEYHVYFISGNLVTPPPPGSAPAITT